MNMDRRQFLIATAGLPLVACTRTGGTPGEIVGPDSALGHRVRDRQMPAPAREVRTKVVVVGGGIAGLAAARQLERRGTTDFILLELERETGGNASCGRNEVSAYPWGAHYVPLPGPDATEVLQLFRELGIITTNDSNGRPVYREEYLCHDPMERLHIHGGWQEGLVPQTGLTAEDARQIDAFLAQMNGLRNAQGSDGRPAFTIPVDRSSSDESFLSWDRQSMSEWMNQHGYKSGPLKWYVNYCCRDDFGAPMERVSAWAGLHYFAARRGETGNNAAVLVWPEGNGWLVNRLREPLTGRIRCRSAVWSADGSGEQAVVDAFDAGEGVSIRYRADYAVFAGPRFVAKHVVHGLESEPIPAYSPWMVANLTLSELPSGGTTALSWDNVFYDSRSLGYVVATHQHLDPYPRETVLTYYLPLDHLDPATARQEALGRSHAVWCEMILADLAVVHPELRRSVRRIDLKVWGHGMVTPTPGFLWGGGRKRMAEPAGRIHFAHSDMSGISLFEEAFTRGVIAGNRIADQLT